MKQYIVLSILIVFTQPTYSWVWLYTFSPRVSAITSQYIIEKHNTQPFTQLIFAWNAQRPYEGSFNFYVQAYNPRTSTWGNWHHMYTWGSHEQLSLSSPSDGHTQYAHVRLEAPPTEPASGFRIKITASSPQVARLLQKCYVTISHFPSFTSEVANTDLQLSSVEVHNFPTISQFALNHADAPRICSPTSCAMLLQGITRQHIDPIAYALQVFDPGLNAYGNWCFNTAAAYNYLGPSYNMYPTRLPSFSALHNHLQRGIPVIVSVRGSLTGAPRNYPHGHLLMVCGYNAPTHTVICHDPAHETDNRVKTSYKLEDFLAAWERSHRLSYIIQPYD